MPRGSDTSIDWCLRGTSYEKFISGCREHRNEAGDKRRGNDNSCTRPTDTGSVSIDPFLCPS